MSQGIFCFLDILFLWRIYLAVIIGLLLYAAFDLFWNEAWKYIFMPISVVSIAIGVHWSEKAWSARKTNDGRWHKRSDGQ